MSSGGSEMRGFVFSVIFILIFGALLSSVPVGLQGSGEDPAELVGIDPSIITGFDEIENYTPAAYSGAYPTYLYDYPESGDFGGYEWRSLTDDDTFLTLGAKVYLWVFWFGGIDACKFEAPSGQGRGTTLTFAEIDEDAEEGLVRYSLTFTDSGDSAGSLVIYWNTTAYSSVDDAWDNDDVILIHGIGFDASATTNIAILLVSLLFLQLPEVPTLINILLAAPIWACIIFVLWYVIKEMIPFV
jgi:hypothetical protein